MFGVKDAVDDVDRRTGNGGGVPRWLLVTLVVVAVGIGGFLLFRQLSTPPPTTPPETAVVRRGSINSTVNATGPVIAQDNAGLGFRTVGRVAEVRVKSGDTVQAGQILASLDTTDVELQVAQQQAALASAQAKLDSLQAGPRPEDLASAQAAVANAQANLDTVKAGAASADVASAQQAVHAAWSQVKTARDNLVKLRNGASSQDIRNAQLAVTQAKNSLTNAQINQNTVCDNPQSTAEQCKQAKLQTNNAGAQLKTAENNLAKLRAPASNASIAAATASVHAAENSYNAAVARLNDLKDGPSDAQLAAAEAQLAQAQANLAKVQKPYTDDDLKAAQAAVDQAKAGLDLAQYNLSNATLTAPFDGVVGTVNVIPGVLTSATSPAITLVNPSDIRLDVNVDESDVARVAPGQKATVTFDALSGKEFDGVVSNVAPNATIQSGVATYPVSITIAKGEGIRPGMTGSANIIYAEKSDALLVPNRAVHRDGKDRYVEVLTGDTQEKRPVTIGMTNEEETEIVEGVAEGESVVINTTTSFNFSSASRSGGAMSQPSGSQ